MCLWGRFPAQADEALHQRAEQLVFVVGANGGDGGACKRGGDFRQFAGGKLLCRGKYRQEQNVRMAFYQIFNGGNAPKLDGVLQPDVLGAQVLFEDLTEDAVWLVDDKGDGDGLG